MKEVYILMKNLGSFELLQLKEVCRRELDRSESENTRNQAITSDYKQVCSASTFILVSLVCSVCLKRIIT